MRILKLGLTAVACVVGLSVPVPTAVAQELYDDAFVIASDADERRKSNMASRQEMLIERMIETACFAMIDVETEANWTRLEQAHRLFMLSQTALRDGNAALGLGPETNERVINALDLVDKRYKPFDEMIQQIITDRSFDSDALRALDSKAKGIEKAVSRVQSTIDGIYLRRSYPMRAIVGLNFIGKERVTSQSITRNYCLIAADVDAEVHRIHLQNDAKLFQSRLEALLVGEPLVGLPPAPTGAIADQIGEALRIWAEMLPAIDQAMGRNEIRDDHVTLISDHATPLLAAVNQAVYLYESVQ
ncbi:MAG: hypothetical protein AAGC57_20125 [Pseudomonadota bacterium]